MSSPTPSTKYGRPVPPEYTEPAGSAPMIFTTPPSAPGRPAETSLRYRPVPVIVPPVPAPITQCVMRPSVSCQISGPVVS